MRSYHNQIRFFNGTVWVVSFGKKAWAKNWLAETQAPFPLLLDPERNAYRAYGLDYSLRRSWGLKTMWHYSRLLLTGRRWRGIRGDSGQLGGDFIIDRQGLIQLAYPSHDPTDRPSMAMVLEVLRKVNNG